MNSELYPLAAAWLASMFALVRFALVQGARTADRFTTFLEAALRRQEDVNSQFQGALEQLSATLRRIEERIVR